MIVTSLKTVIPALAGTYSTLDQRKIMPLRLRAIGSRQGAAEAGDDVFKPTTAVT
jgi:hypothetical protein